MKDGLDNSVQWWKRWCRALSIQYDYKLVKDTYPWKKLSILKCKWFMFGAETMIFVL